MNNDKLASNFVTELFAYALSSRTVFETIRAYLKLSYLQREEEKKFAQWIFRNFDKKGRIATVGQIQQQFIKDDSVLEFLADISDIEVDDTKSGYDSIISTFQEYLKKMIFLESNEKIVEAWNRGDYDAAYGLSIKQADTLSRFSIVDGSIETIFGGFKKRQAQRKSEDYNFRFQIPTMIDEIDEVLGGTGGRLGGPETGEYVLWLGMSGAGKSQCLIQMGISAARQGYRVVHFQLEGTKEQCMNRYDAAWTGALYRDVKVGEFSKDRLKTLPKIIKKLSKNDIYVDACEEWGGKTVADVRKTCKEIERKYGKVDVIIIDYLELLEVGDGITYTPNQERFRQEKLSRAMKALAMEFNAVVHTATQSNDVELEQRNDPEFVLSRSNLNEAKNKIRPTDIFVTLNTTIEESKNQIMRLFVDKARDHAGNQVIRIANSFKNSRFYDRKRTAMLIDEEEEE